MKKLIVLSISVLVLVQAKTQGVRIAGTRFTYPIVQKWIDEYNKSGKTRVKLDPKSPADSLDILIASHYLRDGDVKPGQAAIAVARYLLLPVANSDRPGIEEVKKTGISEKGWASLFFADGSKDPYNNSFYPWVAVKREKPSCSSIAFAHHFGYEQANIRGQAIGGDDRDLLNAVKSNEEAISYNVPPVIYDLQTRLPADGVTVIPVDLNENGKIDDNEKLYGDLDELLTYGESPGFTQVPVDHVYFITSKRNARALEFINWVLAEGKQWLHVYGYLSLDAATEQAQKNSLNVLTGWNPSSHLRTEITYTSITK